MSDHCVAIVQARLGSSRYPRKVLAEIAGEPMILHVMRRAAAIPGVHTAIAAIPSGDDELDACLRAHGHIAYMGSPDDVLERFACAARVMAADIIVRVTGDCPLLAPELGGALIERCVQDPSRFYQATTVADGELDGLDVEVMRRWILEAAEREATDDADREHVTTWMRRNVLREMSPNLGATWPFKVSVDTPADLATVRAIHQRLRPGQTSKVSTLVAAANAGVWDV